MDKNYAKLIFNDEKIIKYAGQEAYEAIVEARKTHIQPERVIIEKIAEGIQKWALENGATHYTHWFFPQGGITAEKIVPLSTPAPNSKKEINFSAECLLIGESDGSSFPSGGLRNTFEARGSSKWDLNSPIFIKKFGDSKVLYIPTNFYSFNNESLDKLTPLIKANEALDDAVNQLMKELGYNLAKVTNYVGIEQEYFLIEKQLCDARPDLNILNRTVFGKENKNLQYRVAHYSASFGERVAKFVTDVNNELTMYGITPCAEHLEVSPNQFEIALTYDRSDLVLIQNQILVDVMKQTAEKMNMVPIFDEKPFNGVNGSGKHTNWSVAFGEDNLFSFGSQGEHSLRFLLIMAIFMRAADLYSSLLLGTIATRSNEFRLGEKEAPPMILSIYITKNIADIFEKSVEEIKKFKLSKEYCMCDRNRTSPLAFTGNKFEFRAVGASQSISSPVTYLNTAFAESCLYAVELLKKAPGDLEDRIVSVIKELYSKHSKVVFNGNCYSNEWLVESEKRKLSRVYKVRDAISNLSNENNIELLSKMNVLSKKEFTARVNVSLENYDKTIQLEGAIAIEMLKKYIIPNAFKELKDLTSTCLSALQKEYISKFNEKLDSTISLLEELEIAVAQKVVEKISAVLAKGRNVVDELMPLISKKNSDIPSYDELLLKL